MGECVLELKFFVKGTCCFELLHFYPLRIEVRDVEPLDILYYIKTTYQVQFQAFVCG